MQSRERTPLQRWRDAFRRRERLWIALYLAGGTALLAGFAVYGIALQGAEGWVDRWNGRWSQRLAACEEAFEAGRIAAVLPELVALDREHPARTTIHARDRERERILSLLGHAWFAAGKKRKCLATFDELVAFDPLNWHSHFERAEARRALREPEDALAGYADVLALHPSHLPSVQARIELFAAGGRFAEVVATYEAYLAAWHLAAFEVTLRSGSDSSETHAIDVPVDGRPHRVELPLTRPDGFAGHLTLSTHGYSTEVHDLGWRAARIAGDVTPRTERRLDEPTPTELRSAELVDRTLVAAAADSRATFALTAPAGGGAELWIELSAFKAVDRDTWEHVTTAYRNLVEAQRLEEARARTRVGGCLAGGSWVVP